MKDILKLFIVKMARFAFKIFWIFPTKYDTILFESFEGQHYSDNPKYLYKFITENFGKKYKYVWVLNTDEKIDGACKTVKFLSLRHVFYFTTAKYIVSNHKIESCFPKRKKQLFVNTWHASGAYKSVTLTDAISTRYRVNTRDYQAKNIDFFVSGCQKFSEELSKSWNADIAKFIPTGLPRNDILFRRDLKELKKNIQNKLNLSDDCGYLLFAPTYRGDFRNHRKFDFGIDEGKILLACEKRFGKPFKMLFRAHTWYSEDERKNGNGIIDVSAYPDMQELLLCADVFVTDYSSCMWDFALLNRPGFLYVPDLDEYDSDVGFYTPISDWPFPYARTNEGLEELVLNYSESANIKKIKQHFDLLGSFEKGNACEQIVKYMGL